MKKQDYIVQQKDRGIKILHSLFDLDEIKHPLWKVTKDSRVYNEDDISALEGKVRNWQSETMSVLDAIGISKNSYESVFQLKLFVSEMLDKRKALAEEVQFGLDYLTNILIEEKMESSYSEEESFLQRDFHIEIDKLCLIPKLVPVIISRIDEIEKGRHAKMPLSVIILSGNTLEGVLLNIAQRNQELFNKASSSPKDKNGKVLSYNSWKLDNFIDVAHELGYLKEDVKKFSHSLREFRNYIHPNEQMTNNFIPDMHTAEICIQVLKAAIYQVSQKLESDIVSGTVQS